MDSEQQTSGESGETNAPLAHKTANSRSTRPKDRGRVDILRQTAHRGGKTVTVVKNFVGIGLQVPRPGRGM